MSGKRVSKTDIPDDSGDDTDGDRVDDIDNYDIIEGGIDEDIIESDDDGADDSGDSGDDSDDADYDGAGDSGDDGDDSDGDDSGEDGGSDNDAPDADADAMANSSSLMKKFDFVYSDTLDDAASKEIIIVKNENRVTSHMLSKTEITEAVSIRCAQIQKNPIVFVDITGMDDPIKMAKKEINERKCPLVLRRFIGNYELNDYYEYWDINEMTRPYIMV